MVCSEFASRRIAVRRAGFFLTILLLFVPAVFFPSCAGTGSRREAETGAASPDAVSGPQDAELPASLRFVPAPLSGIRPVPGAGLVTREQRDLGGALTDEDRDRLSACFRDAYTEGLLRDLPL